MIATAHEPPIVSRVETTLRELRKNNVRHGVMFAIVVAVATLSVMIVIAVWLDWYFGWLSSATRWMISLIAWAITSSALVAIVAWVLRSRRRRDELAEQADTSAPVFEERLQTITSVRDSDRVVADRHMMHKVMEETETLYLRVNPAELVQTHRFAIPITVTGVCAFVLAAMFAAETRSTSVLLTRFLWPSTSLTRTQVEADLDDQLIGEGETWIVSGRVNGYREPTVLLEQRLAPGHISHRTLELAGTEGDEFRYAMSRANKSFQYRLTAGDFRSDWAEVTVAKRPRIVSTKMRVIPPAYTNRKERHLTKIPKKLTVIKGSTIKLDVRAEGEIDRAEWILQPDHGTRSMFLGDDGDFQCSIQIDESVRLSPRLVEPNGLENRNRFEINIQAINDKPPTVKITHPSPDTAVRPNDTVRIEFEARDDIGVQSARLVINKTDQITGETIDLKSIPIPVDAKKDRRRLKGAVDVDLSEFGLEHGETINYRVDVYDNKQLGASTDPNHDSEQAHSAKATTEQQTNRPDEPSRPDGSVQGNQADSMHQNERSSEPDAADSNQNGDPANSDTQKTNSTSSAKSDSEKQESASNTSRESSASEPTNSSDAGSSKQNPKSSDEGAMKIDETESAEQSQQQTDSADAQNEDETDDAQVANSSGSPANPSPSERNDSNNSRSSAKSSESDSKPSEQNTPNDSGPKPTMRALDMVKPSSSPEMKLKIDKYAGRFDGQARRKLEIAIEPILANLKKWLVATEQLLASVQIDSETSSRWGEGKQQSLTRAIDYLEQSISAVDELTSRTNGTPYAFIGLQISDVALTHLDPARSDALAALKTQSESRYTLIDNSRIQVTRALARLAELTQRYKREKREQLLAEKLHDFEEVYRVFIEDTLAKLQAQRDRINGIKREGVEFELDEEYLARLKEVLEMRRDLEAELARILSEDPRLLKRFSQSSRNNADNLRDQFTLLARRQYKLTELARQLADEPSPPNGIALRTLEVAYRLMGEFGDSVDRFNTWMPLNEIAPTTEVNLAIQGFREASSKGERLRQSVLEEAQKLEDGEPKYEECQQHAEAFVSTVGDLRQQLIALASSTDNEEIASNAINRLAEIGAVRDKVRGWRFQIDALAAGRKGEALAVDEHQLMIDLHNYADKMSTLPGQIAQLIPNLGGDIPKEIADLSEQLLQTIDNGIEPTQLASVLALRKEDFPKASQRMASADQQFRDAEDIFDQLMIAIVKVLDELPVEDPIASLLNDPTLEEILSRLERELPLNELLGIPNRPSNLRVIGDWLNSSQGNGGGGNGGDMASMIEKMMRSEQRKKEDALKRMRMRLMQHQSDEESTEGEPEEGQRRWAKVISELDDGLIQQRGGGVPEHYRSAIQQYFETISSK